MNIYKTTNLLNGKVYIGQDSKDRDGDLGSGLYLNRTIAKYGIENLKKEIVARCDTKDKLDFLEKFYIKFYNSRFPNGYNITDGGGGRLGKRPIPVYAEEAGKYYRIFPDGSVKELPPDQVQIFLQTSYV